MKSKGTKTIEEFITAVKHTSIDDFNGDFEPKAFELAEDIDEKQPSFFKAIPVIFDLFERFPDNDFGAPGPLVHLVESHGNYEDELMSSLKRMPAIMTFVLMHRLLVSELSDKNRKIYTEAYLSILTNPKTTKAVIELLEDWVNYLIEEDKISQELFEEYQAKKTAPKVKSIETFINELNQVTEKDPKSLSRLLKTIAEDVNREDPSFAKAMSAIFNLFERYDEYPNLGPLPGMMKKNKLYINELKMSLLRKPSVQGVSMMIDVLWEEEISDEERKVCSAVYRAVLTLPNASEAARDKAKNYMDDMVKERLLV